ncbi:MAG: hydrogen peroxide-dependent heme synthase [Bryobacteraceae bacterium]
MTERPQTIPQIATPAVPLTLEGASILHQMFRIRWPEWRKLNPVTQRELVQEAVKALSRMEQASAEEGQSALFSILGHKGDLLLVHFRRDFEGLNAAELALTALGLSDYLEPTSSYVSVVELGLYESTVKLQAALASRSIEPGSEEWDRETEQVLAQQRRAMQPRLWPEIPPRRYLCFYPMDKRRGESKNWYMESMRDRQRMMQEHGLIGRKYAGEVKQIISGSIGFDDWEWGVDLFADDPVVFKKLIYEMRFDEASAVYALFGPFYIGLRFPAGELGRLLNGEAPEFPVPAA